MSEYQYYEFLAVDRVLTVKERAALRRISTRATITSTSFANDYRWGDLKARPLDLLRRYFDVYLYLANWGSRIFAMRLPAVAFSASLSKAYLAGSGAAARRTKTHFILELHSEDEDPDGGDWEDGGGWMASLAPVRAEILLGDHRSLYLAWLLATQEGVVADTRPEPPVPPGLSALTAAQTALTSFLRIDAHLLAAAAEASLPEEDVLAGLPDWIHRLSAREKDGLLVRTARGESQAVQHALLSRYARAMKRSGTPSPRESRTAGDLSARAEVLREAAAKREARRRARLRNRRKAAAAAARTVQLDALSSRGSRAWADVEHLVRKGDSKAYDEAVALLADLREIASRHEDNLAEFEKSLMGVRARHGRRRTLMARLDRAARLGWES